MAALTFSKMSNSGLNGPTNGNAQRGSTWCGSNGDYASKTDTRFESIVTNSGLSITGKGGGLNGGSTGFADKIYEQLKMVHSLWLHFLPDITKKVLDLKVQEAVIT